MMTKKISLFMFMATLFTSPMTMGFDTLPKPVIGMILEAFCNKSAGPFEKQVIDIQNAIKKCRYEEPILFNEMKEKFFAVKTKESDIPLETLKEKINFYANKRIEKNSQEAIQAFLEGMDKFWNFLERRQNKKYFNPVEFYKKKSAAYPGRLRLVCKRWKEIVDLNISANKFKAYKDMSLLSQKWLQQKNGVPGHEEAFNTFINGKLVYRPKEKSDEGMIVFNILDLKKPFSSRFDLSKCGDMAKYLFISTGFRKEYIHTNNNKIETWLCPRFLIQNFLDNKLARDNELDESSKGIIMKCFKLIVMQWEKEATIGIFYTLGNWKNLDMYECLTQYEPKYISEDDLDQNLRHAWTHNTSPMAGSKGLKETELLKKFTFIF